MKPFFRILLFVLILLSFFSCRETSDFSGAHFDLKVRELSNGLKVIVVEDHSIPLVSYQTWFKVGSVDETPGITGMTHFFEHLFFKGTPRFKSREFFKTLEMKGAEVNAVATRDHTVFYESFTPDLFDSVVELESDRMKGLAYHPRTFNSQKLIVLEERRLHYESSPDIKIQEALWRLAFKRHSYRWPVMGMPNDLLTITLDKAKDWFQTYFQPSNAAVVIVGDIQAERAFEAIQKAYREIPSQKRPKRDVPTEHEQTEERRLVLHESVASEKLVQGYHISSAEQSDSYALDILSSIVFDGESSRAGRRMMHEKNIALNVGGTAFTPTYPGLFVVSVVMNGKVPAEKAESEIDRLIEEVQEGGKHPITEVEVRSAVKSLSVQLLDSVQTFHGLAQLIGTVQMVFGDPRLFSQDLSKYLKVTVSDVRRVVKKYLYPNNRSVVTVVPKP
jgi:zinc protease